MPKLVGAGISGSVIRQPLVNVEIITKPKELGNTILTSPGAGGPLSYYDGTIALGPVAYYRFNELEADPAIAVDDIGVLSANGSYINSPVREQLGIPGAFPDTSVNFISANTSYVEDCGDVDDFSFIQNTGVFTYETWCYMNTVATGQDRHFISNAVGLNDKGILIKYQGSQDKLFVIMWDGTGSTVLTDLKSSTGIFSDDTWHYVVVSGNGSSVSLYVDTVLVGTEAYQSSLPSGSSSYPMGLASNFGISPFNGRLDEMAFYDKELTSLQQSSQYNAGIAA